MNWEELQRIFSYELFKLGGQTPVSLQTLFQFGLVLASVAVVANLTRRVLRTQLLQRTGMDAGLQYSIARIASYCVFMLGLIIGLSTIGVDLTSLTVILGALGVGIGFGLQSIVGNFVSGLIILAERSVQVGDRVDVGGTHGRVVRIGARATTVQTNDNIRIVIPNSEFVSGRFINWSHEGDLQVRLRIPVAVSYVTDARRIEKLLLAVADSNKSVLKSPSPTVVLEKFGDSAIHFELRIWCAEMAHRPGALRSEINFAIWDRFREEGIEIPFPQRDLHLKEPIRIEMKSSD